MSTVALREPTKSSARPIQGTWDWLSLSATRTQKSGDTVTANELDADLHIETTTIMFADVVESVRLIEQDETENVIRIRSLLKHLARDTVPQHQGIVLERRGDGLLVKFPDARCAAACALELHAETANVNGGRNADEVIALRIGVHSAEVIADEHAIYGHGINLAARLANLAEAGQTIASAPAKEQLVLGLDIEADDLGECYLRHVSQPIHAYRLLSATESGRVTTATLPTDETVIQPKVAVLPFVIGVESDARTAASLITDEVTLGLSRVGALRVLSRLTMQNVRSEQCGLRDLHEQFGADYAVSGQVRLRGADIELLYELADTRSQSIVCSDKVCFPLRDVLSENSELVIRVCESVVHEILAHGLRKVNSQPLPTLKSHTLLTAAISLMHRGGQDSDHTATVVLEELMDRHKRNATPFAWAAKQHFLKMWRGWSGDVTKEGALASQYADQSLQKGASIGLSFAVRGMLASHLERDFSKARSYYDQAIIVEPNEPMTWIFRCALHTFDGDGPAAAACASRALDLTPYDPLSYYYKTLAAGGLLTNGQYGDAIRLATAALRQNASHHSTYRVLAIAYGLSGDLESGNQVVRKLRVLDPAFTVSQFLARSPASRAAEYAAVLRAVGTPE